MCFLRINDYGNVYSLTPRREWRQLNEIFVPFPPVFTFVRSQQEVVTKIRFPTPVCLHSAIRKCSPVVAIRPINAYEMAISPRTNSSQMLTCVDLEETIITIVYLLPSGRDSS